MFWLWDKLLYNFCNEWMTCCLIYVLTENYMYSYGCTLFLLRRTNHTVVFCVLQPLLSSKITSGRIQRVHQPMRENESRWVKLKRRLWEVLPC